MEKMMHLLKEMFNNNMNKNDFILTKNEIDFYKFHHLFMHLNLSDDDVYKNIIHLKKIIAQESGCKKLKDSCVNKFNMHLNIRRQENKLYTFYQECPKMEKIIEKNEYKKLFIYDYYENTNKWNYQEIIRLLTSNDKRSKKQLETLKYFMSELQNNKNNSLYLFGKCGTGKTMMSYLFAIFYAKNIKKTISFVYMPELVNIIKLGFSDNEYKEKGNKIIELAKSCDFLILDDIGAEYASDWFYSVYLLDILNYRVTNNKTTIFNSNYSIIELQRVLASKFKNKDGVMMCQRIVERIKQLVGNRFWQLK